MNKGNNKITILQRESQKKFDPIRSIIFIKTCIILGVSYPVKICDFIISDCRSSNSVLEIPLRKRSRECTYLS
jgi:hypothetical protein